MGGILQVDTIQNNNTSNLITQTNVTTITIGTSGQTVSLASGSSSSGFGEVYNGAVNWTSTLVTSSLTVSAGVGYFVNTSTAAITITLPSTPTFGNIVGINDYSGYASTNNITVDPNGNKLEGGTDNKVISTNKESVILNYVDSTRGWLPTSGVNNGTDALSPTPYSVDFLVVAGGGAGGNNLSFSIAGGGGGGAGGYRNSFSTETSGGGGSSEASVLFNVGTVYTVTVGAGAPTNSTNNAQGGTGNNSSISGTGITTITSSGGGGGGGSGTNGGASGGSGGGSTNNAGAGSGTANQGFSGGVGETGGGGGGASAVGGAGGDTNGGNGGAGLASSITGSSISRAGGGGGAGRSNPSGTKGTGGTGGGGNGAQETPSTSATAGTINTGGGGGGGSATDAIATGGAGGKGVVILRMPTARYSGTTTGSPTVGTDGTDTILTFNDSGSYTG
jgi:hypothetical protein